MLLELCHILKLLFTVRLKQLIVPITSESDNKIHLYLRKNLSTRTQKCGSSRLVMWGLQASQEHVSTSQLVMTAL